MSTTQTTEKQRQMVVGKVGRSGAHSHLIEVLFTVEGEGTPWEDRRIFSSRPMCCGNRGQFQQAGHGLRFDLPLNTKTVTCEKCREFRCVEKLG